MCRAIRSPTSCGSIVRDDVVRHRDDAAEVVGGRLHPAADLPAGRRAASRRRGRCARKRGRRSAPTAVDRSRGRILTGEDRADPDDARDAAGCGRWHGVPRNGRTRTAGRSAAIAIANAIDGSRIAASATSRASRRRSARSSRPSQVVEVNRQASKPRRVDDRRHPERDRARTRRTRSRAGHPGRQRGAPATATARMSMRELRRCARRVERSTRSPSPGRSRSAWLTAA